jgi:hypothetical protein
MATVGAVGLITATVESAGAQQSAFEAKLLADLETALVPLETATNNLVNAGNDLQQAAGALDAETSQPLAPDTFDADGDGVADGSGHGGYQPAPDEPTFDADGDGIADGSAMGDAE